MILKKERSAINYCLIHAGNGCRTLCRIVRLLLSVFEFAILSNITIGALVGVCGGIAYILREGKTDAK